MRSILTFIWETIKIIIVSILIVVPIRYFLIQPFFVKGTSMEPNFKQSEYLIIDEISYRFQNPKRGEVIVFKYPYDPSQYYIKRIIGLPGETVEIVGGGIVIYNNQNPTGKRLDEKYLPSNQKTIGNLKITLNEKQYFVLGDNRTASSDSRVWGPVDKDYIVGRVWIRVWPFETAEVFAAPTY